MEHEGVPLEKRFAALCNILRAQHFAWREAIGRKAPGTEPVEVVKEMWKVAGQETAEAFWRSIRIQEPLAPQVAQAIRTSWECTGQEGKVEVDEDREEAQVSLRGCPWFRWHLQHGLQAEDRAGCDAWFGGLVERLNERLGTSLEVETCETLPDGHPMCRRKIRVGNRLHGFQDW